MPQDVREKSKRKGVRTQEEAVMVVELENGSEEAVVITVRHLKFILLVIWPEIMKKGSENLLLAVECLLTLFASQSLNIWNI